MEDAVGRIDIDELDDVLTNWMRRGVSVGPVLGVIELRVLGVRRLLAA
jgi:hypothetical protein